MRHQFARTGKVLAHARTERGLTQKQLAKKLGINSQVVSNYERALNMPPKHALKKLKKTLRFDYGMKTTLERALRADITALVTEEYADLIR